MIRDRRGETLAMVRVFDSSHCDVLFNDIIIHVVKLTSDVKSGA